MRITAEDLRSSGNRLLELLPLEELERLSPEAEAVTLERDFRLIVPNETIRDAWFPVTCLASLVTVLDDGSTVEAGAVGREGMVGIPVVLGAVSTPMQTVVQVPGKAIRIPAQSVVDAFDRDGVLKQALNRYIHTLFLIASQSAACNRRHQVEARLARWLLMSADGIGSDRIAITHDYLAAMLGVRRSSVTDTALKLQEQGLIDYGRALVTITDRPGLEASACECYESVRAGIERTFAGV